MLVIDDCELEKGRRTARDFESHAARDFECLPALRRMRAEISLACVWVMTVEFDDHAAEMCYLHDTIINTQIIAPRCARSPQRGDLYLI